RRMAMTVALSPHATQRGRRPRSRALVYSFLAQGLAPPGDGFFRAVADGSLRAILDEALRGLPPDHRRACVQPLGAALSAAEASAPDQLLIEYTRLFGNAVLCPHYEADHVSGDAFPAVHVLAAVAGFYEAFGVRVAADA